MRRILKQALFFTAFLLSSHAVAESFVSELDSSVSLSIEVKSFDKNKHKIIHCEEYKLRYFGNV